MYYIAGLVQVPSRLVTNALLINCERGNDRCTRLGLVRCVQRILPNVTECWPICQVTCQILIVIGCLSHLLCDNWLPIIASVGYVGIFFGIYSVPLVNWNRMRDFNVSWPTQFFVSSSNDSKANKHNNRLSFIYTVYIQYISRQANEQRSCTNRYHTFQTDVETIFPEINKASLCIQHQRARVERICSLCGLSVRLTERKSHSSELVDGKIN